MWLRVKADGRAACDGEWKEKARRATFEYSYDGTAFSQLGPTYTLTRSVMGYVGYRFGLFNFATQALGGELRVNHCDMEIWDLSE